MVVTAKIEKLEDGKLVLKPDTDISRFVEQKRPRRVEVRLDDGRTISVDQRRKIFAIIRDISLWSGHEPEELRQYLEWDFCSRAMREWFSLSDCDMTTAREFITYLISFCFHWGVPTKDSLLTQTDDIGKYLYLCLENRRCAICNRPAEVHHVDRIGMGMDREKGRSRWPERNRTLPSTSRGSAPPGECVVRRVPHLWNQAGQAPVQTSEFTKRRAVK